MPGTHNSGGRNAKSRAALQLAGTFKASRHAERKTPEPPKGRPAPPKPLEGDAMAEWHAMTADLEVSGTLSVTDRMALYQYCRLYAETEEIAARGPEYAGSIQALEDTLAGLTGAELVACFQESGKLHALRAANESKVRQGRMALRQYLVEFGMTPSARNRVKVNDTGGQSAEERELDAITSIQ